MSTNQTVWMRPINLGIILAILLIGCGDDAGGDGLNTGIAGTLGTTAGVGAAGTFAGTPGAGGGGGAGSPGAAGITAPRPAGMSGGQAGALAAGAGGARAGSGAVGGAAAGSSGSSGSVAAGSGGTAPVAGAGGGAAMPSGDAIIRGDDPTEQTVMGNGPFEFESYTDGFLDGAQFLAATIYYPTDAEPPFAGVVACPGFTAFQDSVAPWGPFLASHGIVVMTIDTNTNLDSVDIRQGALMDALMSLKGEHTRSGSPLNGKLHMNRFGLMGWSMGGGGTWLNASMHPELKTGISLAGHIATAGGATRVSNVTVPILLLAGSADTAILGLGMSQPVYEVIPETTPKLLYELSGGSHFDIAPETGSRLFGKYGLSWQKVFLEGDERYRKFLIGPKPDNASDFRSNVK